MGLAWEIPKAACKPPGNRNRRGPLLRASLATLMLIGLGLLAGKLRLLLRGSIALLVGRRLLLGERRFQGPFEGGGMAFL